MAKLNLIDLDFDRSGYRRFVSSWLYRSETLTYLVDPGPTASFSQLVAALADVGVESLDFVLLTHIHIDHAGSSGDLAREFPAARFVCHPRGAAHLIQPDRLWEGSLAVLQETARMFGRPRPVPEAALADPDAVAAFSIESLETPGHAPHHLCFLHDRTLFAGEVAGTRYPLPDDAIYMRPATPPRFFPQVALESLALVRAQAARIDRLAFAHYGMVDDTDRHLEIAAGQIDLWVQTVRAITKETGRCDWSRTLQDDVVAALLQADPHFANFSRLPDDIQTRELEYFRNTLDGILGWVKHAG
jgi:glyoxylase-like metal-dependent hydrolase (beta-lactamase superfamily II)